MSKAPTPTAPKPGDPAPPGAKCADKNCRNRAKVYELRRTYGGDPYVVDERGRPVAPHWRQDDSTKLTVAPPVLLCGVHLRTYTDRKAKAERAAARDAEQKRHRAKVREARAQASNLAQFLSEQLGIELTAERPAHEPETTYVVAMSIETAQRLYSGHATLVQQ